MRPIRMMLLACSLACLHPSAAGATFPGANGEILHGRQYWQPENSIGIAPALPSSQEDGCCFVSTGAVQDAANAAWSPDGTRIAFDGPATRLGDGRALYVMNADGSGLVQVGRGDRQRFDPAWSPDGTRLAFEQDGDIHTITTAGGGLTQLTTSAGWDGRPDWSPDGTQIAYACGSGGRIHLCRMTPTGASKTLLASGVLPGDVVSASWAPDSTALVLALGADGGAVRILRITRDGRSFDELTPPPAVFGEGEPVGGVAWSPDGDRIAYNVCWGGECALVTARAVDGGDAVIVKGYDDDFPVDPGGWRAVAPREPRQEPQDEATALPSDAPTGTTGPAPAPVDSPAGVAPSAPTPTTLSRAEAQRTTLTALRNRFRARFTARRGYRSHCRRDSRVRWTCRVSWRHGPERLRGSVVIERGVGVGYETTVRVRRG